MLKFPYGISDFQEIITQGYFYVDRTALIQQLESVGKQILFLRPRRFGKTLLLSLLENYYDINRTEQFESLFGGLAIGKTPTTLHNHYLILRLDFSTVEGKGDYQQIRRSLFDHINTQITNFLRNYQSLLQYQVNIDSDNALASLADLASAVSQTPYRIYLLIDEYDNFANEVLMASSGSGRGRYEELVKGEGLYKTVFKVVKSLSSGMGIDRVFITGVSPIVMADISSGYNVAENIYLMPEFNALCGFTEAEVGATLEQVATACNLSAAQQQETLALMRTFYNGYCFERDLTERLYNPTLVLYFLKSLQQYCKYPDELLDNNLAMDRTRILYVSQLQGAEDLVELALNEGSELTVASLAHRFGVTEMIEDEKSSEFLLALLYYLGVLTLDGRTEQGELRLRIPNLVIRRLYAERLRDQLLPTGKAQDAGKRAAKALYQQGELQPLCTLVEEKILRTLDNRDYLHANELTIKTAFLSLLFEDHFYIVDSEKALERGYADLSMIIRPDMRHFKLFDILLEFKFVKLGELTIHKDEVKAKNEAELRQLGQVQDKLAEARTQLQRYRVALANAYGPSLRLRTFAIVSLGFDRLIWEEISQ